jgi:hypothetical protein
MARKQIFKPIKNKTMKTLLIFAVGLLMLTAFGIVGEYYFVLPEFVYTITGFVPINLFYLICFVVQFIAGIGLIVIVIAIERKNKAEKVNEMQQKINHLNAYKLNYHKLKKSRK